MKIKFLFLFSCFVGFIGFASFSQDTIYYVKNLVQVYTPDSAENILIEYNGNRELIIQKYYAKGFKLLSETTLHYNENEEKVKNGKHRTWYGSGELKSEVNYKNGKLDGLCLCYWKNDKPKRHDQYKDGKLEKGNCYDSLGNKMAYTPYEKLPEFPGGAKKLMMYLSKNVNYPAQALAKNEQGRVLVSFVVQPDGTISDLVLEEGISLALNAEALRVIRKMPKWEPGYQEGELAAIKYYLPVYFKLH